MVTLAAEPATTGKRIRLASPAEQEEAAREYAEAAADVDGWVERYSLFTSAVDMQWGYELARQLGVPTVRGDTHEPLTPDALGPRLKLGLAQQTTELPVEVFIAVLDQALGAPSSLITDWAPARATLRSFAQISSKGLGAAREVATSRLGALTAGVSLLGTVPATAAATVYVHPLPNRYMLDDAQLVRFALAAEALAAAQTRTPLATLTALDPLCDRNIGRSRRARADDWDIDSLRTSPFWDCPVMLLRYNATAPVQYLPPATVQIALTNGGPLLAADDPHRTFAVKSVLGSVAMHRSALPWSRTDALRAARSQLIGNFERAELTELLFAVEALAPASVAETLDVLVKDGKWVDLSTVWERQPAPDGSDRGQLRPEVLRAHLNALASEFLDETTKQAIGYSAGQPADPAHDLVARLTDGREVNRQGSHPEQNTSTVIGPSLSEDVRPGLPPVFRAYRWL